MSRDISLHDHYSNGAIYSDDADNFQKFFTENGVDSYEEFVLHQGCVYLSIQEKGNQSSDFSQSSGMHEAEFSRATSANSQEALDEALARSLQELEDDFDDFELTERTSTTVVRESLVEAPVSVEAPARATSQNSRPGDIDPDNMTYEEMNELRQTVGVVKIGLAKEDIDQLPTSKYKTGFFSKKKETEDCVICQMEYKSGDKLITLPCQHRYHSKCIGEWLTVSKDCPVCKREVQLAEV